MPSCFQILKEGTPVNLNDLDRQICEMLEVPCSETNYQPDFWYGVGFNLATGSTLESIANPAEANREQFAVAAKIAQWLIDNGYTSTAFYESRR